MQLFKRPLFICSAIETCKETANCCAHKKPHIKDERCVLRECRHAPGIENIDCVPYDPEKTATTSTTTSNVVPDTRTFITPMEPTTPQSPEEPDQELDIKEAVKKAQKKGGRKK